MIHSHTPLQAAGYALAIAVQSTRFTAAR